jgi:hypothetical protein
VTLKFLIAALLVCSVAAMGAPPPLLVLDQHDYVFPRLSPDGRHLVVARAIQRPDGTETTDAVVLDLATGASRELISQREAEANETYETFVIGLRWLDDRRVEVSLSDGDVGGADLIVDVDTGKVLSTDYEDDGDSLVPSAFAEIAADARFYSRHFSREELEQSLGTSAVRVNSSEVLVQRTARASAMQPVFYFEPAKRRAKRIASVPASVRLRDAARVGSRILFLSLGDDGATVHSYNGCRARTVASWPVPTQSECGRIEAFGARVFVFMRPCTRSEPVRARLWEVTRGAALERSLDNQLDEFSASADGSRIAVAVWRNGRRVVQVFDGPVLRPAG